MKTALTTPVNSNQTTQTSQLIPASPTSVESPLEEVRAMNTALTTPANSNQTSQTSQLIPAVENPSTWMRNGDTPGEIILAVAILTSVSIAGIASVIVAITGLVKSLVPVMVRPTKEKKE